MGGDIAAQGQKRKEKAAGPPSPQRPPQTSQPGLVWAGSHQPPDPRRSCQVASSLLNRRKDMTRGPSMLRILVTCALLLGAVNASAQSYPTHAITLVVPFGAGSGTDVMART